MLRRGQERREERHDGPAASNKHHYQMRENLISIGDDFWIENEAGQRAYKVDGKAVRVRNTLVIEDASGREICKIQEKMLRIKDTMEIEGPNGEHLATVKKALITPVRERWTVNVQGGPDLDVQGNILDHEYRIGNVAEVSKKWFRIRDTYGVEIEEGQNYALILAVAFCTDQMSR